MKTRYALCYMTLKLKQLDYEFTQLRPNFPEATKICFYSNIGNMLPFRYVIGGNRTVSGICKLRPSVSWWSRQKVAG